MANSGITVTNNGLNGITIAGQVIAGQGGSHTFDASGAATTCTDVNLRMGWLNGSLTVSISGNPLDPTVTGSEDVLDQIVSGAITVS